MDYYDIDKILNYAMVHAPLLAVSDRLEWVRLGQALKALGYDKSFFVALSWQDQKTATEAERVWKANKALSDNDKAVAAIVGMAKAANMDLEQFKSDTDTEPTPPRATAQEDFAEVVVEAPIYVDTAKVKEMEAQAEQSSLFKYFCTLFPTERVREVFALYRVGAMATRRNDELRATFPLINELGQIVDVRIIPYKENGHRKKETDGEKYPTTFYLALTRQKESRGKWCLFGAHLATTASTAVGIVESEKTALMCAMAVPGTVWMATTSLSNLQADRLEAIKSNELKVFPDADGVEHWRTKVEALKAQGFNISFCSDYITRHTAKGSKDDLGDIIERQRKEVYHG